MKEITATNAKNKFGDVLHEVLGNKEQFRVMRNGRPVALIVPFDSVVAITGSETVTK